MNMKKNAFFAALCLPIVLLLITKPFHKAPLDDRYDRILHIVGQMLKQGHYSPKNLDNQFSEKIHQTFLKELDEEKSLFLQGDIDDFKPFQQSIDEEIDHAPVDFFYKVNERYKLRLGEIKGRLANLSKIPFDFSKKDSLVTEFELRNYPKNAKVQDEFWTKKLKFIALEKFVDLQEQKEKSKTDSLQLTDAQMEQKAREFALTTMDKSLDRMLNKTSDDDRFSMFVTTITNLMDPHTDFFMPVEKRAWNEKLSGKFYGIGALIGQENGYLQISSVSPGGPAWKTGDVNDGDLIMKIGEGDKAPVDVAGFDIPDGVKLIRGDRGTTVKLTLKKADGTLKVVAIEREELKLEETFAKSCIISNGERKTGYLFLPKFYTPMGDDGGRSCADDVAAELVKLKAAGVDGIVMDLRNNGGGSLYEVVKMAGLFVPSGPMVQVRDGDGKVSPLFDRDEGNVVYEGPLVVMVNEFSASASEIFAAAIQDYKRGVIVGSSSYGKGTVQRPIALSRLTGQPDVDLGTVHLTIQKYYRINGSSTQLKGVIPDLVLPGSYENYKVREKDNESALVWDEIKKQGYATWNKAPDLNFISQRFKTRVDSTGYLSKIQANTAWLAAQRETALELNIERFKAKDKAINERAKATRELFQLSKEMNVQRLGEDKDASPSSASYNTRWVNSLKKDRYLYEASRVVDDINESLSKSPVSMKKD
jgi:carboxyl-terminal processing protease